MLELGMPALQVGSSQHLAPAYIEVTAALNKAGCSIVPVGATTDAIQRCMGVLLGKGASIQHAGPCMSSLPASLCAGIITQHLLEVPHVERLNQLHKLLRNRHSENLSCCLHVLRQELQDPKVPLGPCCTLAAPCQELNANCCTHKLLRRQPSPRRAAAYMSSSRMAAAADACGKGPLILSKLQLWLRVDIILRLIPQRCQCCSIATAAALPWDTGPVSRFFWFLQAFATRTVAAAAVVTTVNILEAGTEWGHLDALPALAPGRKDGAQ